MKVLSRRVNEGVVIAHDINVTVLEIGETFVCLGITQPGHDPEYWEGTLYLQREEADVAEELIGARFE